MESIYENPMEISRRVNARPGDIEMNIRGAPESVEPSTSRKSQKEEIGKLRALYNKAKESSSSSSRSAVIIALFATLLISSLAISVVSLIYSTQDNRKLLDELRVQNLNLSKETQTLQQKLINDDVATRSELINLSKEVQFLQNKINDDVATRSELKKLWNATEHMEETLIDVDTKIQVNKEKLEIIESNLTALRTIVSTLAAPTDCEEYRTIQIFLADFSGDHSIATLYPFKQIGDMTTVKADCVFNGSEAWMVIQRRIDGSVDFYRNWLNYTKGFGNISGEYWIGLENLNKLTTTRKYILRIDLQNWENERRFAEYSAFQVGDKESDYKLTISGYTGDVKDGMAYHNGMKFSAFDHDNTSIPCAKRFQGAWWYKSCYQVNLNGRYHSDPTIRRNDGVVWYGWLGQYYPLKFVEMKIRPV